MWHAHHYVTFTQLCDMHLISHQIHCFELSENENKTKIMIFCMHDKKLTILKINGTQVEIVDDFLDIKINKSLNWKEYLAVKH